MSKSIRYYYFTSIAAVLVSSMLVMGLIQTWLSVSYSRGDKQEQLEQVVRNIAAGVEEGQFRFDDGSLSGIDYLARVAEASVVVTNATGIIVHASTMDAANPDIPEVRLSDELLQRVSETDMYKELGTLGGSFLRKHYIYATPLRLADGTFMGVAVAFSDASNIKGYVSDMMSSFILSGCLVLLVASMLALVLTNRTVIPIRRVSSAARRFGEGDYSARVPVEGDDELAQLALTFNEMAASCEATDISRRSFMGNIAHELRTPMTSIKGFIDGMLDGTIPQEDQPKYLKIVSEEVGRLARLTKNMLDISKLEAGEYTPELTSFDIWEPLTSVVLSAEQRLEEKHIEVMGLDARDTPVTVLADEDFSHQVVFNLVDNAIKFTNDYGKITVAAHQGKGFATITVHNTGAGVPADTLPYIFDRFYKADQSRGINAGGSGLGLHICKVLVGLMGGRIWAESEEGVWTAFKFTLPTAPAPRARNARWAEGRVKAEPEDEEAR